MKSKRRWRWVVRDDRFVTIYFGLINPQIKLSDYTFTDANTFKTMYGFLPFQDKPVKVEFSAKVIE